MSWSCVCSTAAQRQHSGSSSSTAVAAAAAVIAVTAAAVAAAAAAARSSGGGYSCRQQLRWRWMAHTRGLEAESTISCLRPRARWFSIVLLKWLLEQVSHPAQDTWLLRGRGQESVASCVKLHTDSGEKV